MLLGMIARQQYGTFSSESLPRPSIPHSCYCCSLQSLSTRSQSVFPAAEKESKGRRGGDKGPWTPSGRGMKSRGGKRGDRICRLDCGNSSSCCFCWQPGLLFWPYRLSKTDISPAVETTSSCEYLVSSFSGNTKRHCTFTPT